MSPERKKQTRRLRLIVLGVAVVTGVVLGLYFAFFQRPSSEGSPPPQAKARRKRPSEVWQSCPG